MTKITPPEELSPRIIARDSPRRPQEDSVRSSVHATVIRWRDLVLAAWELSDDEQYTGRLPEGMSSQQFWAKVTRAAKAMHGTIGIETYGRGWWVWPGRRGVAGDHASRSHRPTRWSEIWESLRKLGIAKIDGKLPKRSDGYLRSRASYLGIYISITYNASGDYTEIKKRQGRKEVHPRGGVAEGAAAPL